ncbi:MAG: glycosyltransferase family 9 protein [Pseudonocardiales bacterium]
MTQRVLVARLDSDGDVLMAGPAIRAVAASGARVTLLCGPAGRQAAELLPGSDELVVFAAPWVGYRPPSADPAGIGDLVAKLRARRLDSALILTSYHQSALPLALLLRLAGVGRIAATSEDYPGSLLDIRHPYDGTAHEVDRSLALVAAAGYPLPPDDDGRLAVRGPLPPVSHLVPAGPYVVVHPGASVPARAWPAGHCAAAAELLAGRGTEVVVTGGPAERGLTRQVAGGRATDLGGRTTFAELAAVLAGAKAVVVGNTGPAHLAAAVATPVVSLFAPVVPAAQWGPYSVPTVVLGDQNAPCRGSRARTCPVEGHPCLSAVTPEQVADAIERLAAVPA